MTTDQFTPDQKAGAQMFFGDSRGWGFGMAVVTRRDGLSGGIGTSADSDPVENLVGILMTQRAMESPEPPSVFRAFRTSAYQATDD